MENQNLNAAPTLKELDNAGFIRETHDEDGYKFTYTKILCALVEVRVSFDHDYLYSFLCLEGGHFMKKVKTTKEAINKEFEHFNQPLPQWEQPRPKVGEVWENSKTVYLINDTVLKATSRVTIVSDNDLETGTIVNIVSYGLTKVADTLEEYFHKLHINNK